jgi:hypothetical protein
MPPHDLLFRSIGVGDGIICGFGPPGRGLSWVSSWLYFQDSAHGRAADLQSAGNLGFADAGTVQRPNFVRLGRRCDGPSGLISLNYAWCTHAGMTPSWHG